MLDSQHSTVAFSDALNVREKKAGGKNLAVSTMIRYPRLCCLKNGGADRDRTDDLLNAIQALSQTELQPHPE